MPTRPRKVQQIMVLFINACVREGSRTRKLAEKLIQRIGEETERLDLARLVFPVTDESFLKKRDRLIAAVAYQDPLFDLARQFAGADIIVIAAPYWDLSFPAVLKQYIEQINVLGITFRYTSDGKPLGLCKAKKLYYVMTAGGTYVPEDYGYGYIKALAHNFYGIGELELIQAIGLDIEGADTEAIIRDSLDHI